MMDSIAVYMDPGPMMDSIAVYMEGMAAAA